MAEALILLRDAPKSSVFVRCTFWPALTASATPAQALALELETIAKQRENTMVPPVKAQAPGYPDGVEAVSLLRPTPGDLLVLRCNKHLTRDQNAALTEWVEKKIPAGVHVLALDADIEVAAIQNPNLPTTP